MGFTSSDGDYRVCKLQKSIYELKQASQSWNHHFDDIIKSFDFIKNEEEPYVYKRVNGSAITFFVLYVDDILLIGNNIPMLTMIKRWLSKEFSIKDIGEVSYILRIKIYKDTPRRMLVCLRLAFSRSTIETIITLNALKGY